MFGRSIILIGMPGCGKSTIGRLLSSDCGMKFADTDDLLKDKLGMTLQNYIDKFGREDLAKQEESFLKEMKTPDEPMIIATGGSAVLYPEAMMHLKEIGTVVFLDCDLPLLRKRLWNFESRGIISPENQDREAALMELYMVREPLYYKYCDVRIDQGRKSRKTIVSQIIKGVTEYEERT